jgi:hypothetical protein
MRTRVTAVLGALLLAIVVAAGCSDGDGDEGADDSGRDDETEASSGGGDETTDTTDDGASPDGDDEGDTSGGEGDIPEGSDPEVRQEYIDAIVASADTGEASPFDAQAAECLATAFVDAAGTDALTEAGVTPQQLAEAEESPAELGIEFPEGAGDVFYDEVSSCMDLRELILASLTGEENAELRDCVSDALDDDMIKDFFVGSIIEGFDEEDPEFAPVQERIDAAVEPCLTAETGEGGG